MENMRKMVKALHPPQKKKRWGPLEFMFSHLNKRCQTFSYVFEIVAYYCDEH